MSRIVVAGTLDELSETLDVASKLGSIHMLDYDGEIEDISLGSPNKIADEVSSLLVKMRGCAAEIKPTKGPRKSLAGVRSLLDGEFPKHLDKVLSKINALEDTKNNLDKTSQNLTTIIRIATLNLDLELLSDYNSLSCWIGEFGNLQKLKADLEKNANVMCFSGSNGKRGVAAVFCDKEISEEIQSTISECDFDAITTPNSSGSAKDLVDNLEKEKEKLITTQESFENEIDSWNSEHGADLLACIELLERDLEILNAPVRVAVSEHAFVMDGWIPTSSVKESSVALKMVSTVVETEKFESAPHHGHHDEHHEEHDEELPPIAYTDRNISKPFELLTDLVGRPRYGRIDPTMFMLFTYPIFFGMMLGDMIYGIFTIMLGLWIKNKFSDNEAAILASRLVVYIGISCVIFGYLYAEFAGWEIFIYEKVKVNGVYVYADKNSSPVAFLSALYPFDLHHGYGPSAELPFGINLAFPFHRVGSNMSDLIVIALYLGILHLALGFIIGIIDVAKGHGLVAAFFEKGSWLIVLVGGFLACYGFLVGNGEGLTEHYASAMSDLVFYGGITLVIGIICLCYGLAKYEGFGPIGIFVGPLETISLLSNVLSYIRLMAIGVVGVKIAEAGNMLGYDNMIKSFELVANGDFLAIISGIVAMLLWIGIQLFAWVLGVFSPNIHAARLHFVEWMKQFYDGSGEPFKPFGSKPKLVEVE
ncbi:MAG: hypothetical protein CMB48_01115 [Euryarchaeota archaeon]|nr:hypothetical protein [Euryarchaeota archaeon]|tara:strand:- start:1293 stop:3404 length:2112 start_codon:yes stop_codon:yes gene_type:complete